MPFQLENPLQIETHLTNLAKEDPPIVVFRQATAKENQLREQMVFGPQARVFTDVGMELHGSVVWSVRRMIECRLTMVSMSGFLDKDGNELFTFKNGKTSMSPDAWAKAWGKITRVAICKQLHDLCMDANPDWDYRPTTGVMIPQSEAEANAAG